MADPRWIGLSSSTQQLTSSPFAPYTSSDGWKGRNVSPLVFPARRSAAVSMLGVKPMRAGWSTGNKHPEWKSQVKGNAQHCRHTYAFASFHCPSLRSQERGCSRIVSLAMSVKGLAQAKGSSSDSFILVLLQGYGRHLVLSCDKETGHLHPFPRSVRDPEQTKSWRAEVSES